MNSLSIVSQEGKPMPHDQYPQTAESILLALEAAIDARAAASRAFGELSAKKLAILELVRLSHWPASDVKQQRIAALVEEFGQVDVDRWTAFIESGV